MYYRIIDSVPHGPHAIRKDEVLGNSLALSFYEFDDSCIQNAHKRLESIV